MSVPFSYAQAARGQVTGPSSAPQTTTADSNNGMATESVTSSAQSTTPSTALSTVSNDIDSAADPAPSQSGQSDLANQVTLDSDVQTNKEEDTSAAASVQQPSAQPQNEKKQSSDAVSQGTDRRHRGNTTSTRGADVADVKKSGKRNNKKSRGNEKDSEPEQSAEKEKEVEEPKVELADAPLPVVNPWTKRAEVQATKAKTSPSPSVAPQSSHGSNKPSNVGASSTVEPRSIRPAASNGAESNGQQTRMTNGAKASKKASEASRDGNRPVPRGNRAGDKNGKDVADSLPAVSDPSSWPTPDTAATEVKSQEKDDVKDDNKSDNKSDTGSNQKTKWVQMDFVPTVTFSTQINRGTGRGGSRGGSRGGREAGARASNAASASSAERNNSGAKHTGEKSAEAGANGTSKRASVDGAMASRDARKSAGTTGDAARAPVSQINGKAEPFKPSQGAHSSSASEQQQGAEASKGTANKYEQGSRMAEGQKEPSQQGSKNFQNNREGRRGGARGRGGHSNANSLSHHGYPPNGQHFAGPNMAGPNMAGRQNPYAQNMSPMGYGAPFPGMNAASGHRGPNRSQSASSNTFHQRGQANGSRSYRPGPPQMNNAAYGPMMPPHEMVPMPAPYYPSEPNTLVDLVVNQLEYYFSVENMCKDLWIRQRMDSQGYVKLEIIREFKRMKQITQDYAMLRFACEQAPSIEFVVGEDQLERVRRRDGWADWVLPNKQRDASVASDPGPQSVFPPNRPHYNAFAPQMMPAHYPMEHHAVYSPGYMEHQYTPYMNGFSYGHPRNTDVGDNPNGQAAPGESRLSANVPEFSPMMPPTAQFPDQAKQAGEVAATNGEAAPLTNGASENGVPYTNGVGESVVAESQ
ncbi:hypothetical protein PGQ11_003680 [Apiospora arundinis]|uniref:HTH La-type RNA-binding domain-containing protein n=1 Tax=Apiospora arundinis TaxID=335852 RepID=A0ABR2J5V2_9PEZI